MKKMQSVISVVAKIMTLLLILSACEDNSGSNDDGSTKDSNSPEDSRRSPNIEYPPLPPRA